MLKLLRGAALLGVSASLYDDMSIFRAEPPSYQEVLAVRAERQRMVSDFLETATADVLAEERDDPWGGDWHPTVGDCVRVILEEEWAHLRYIRRDLALVSADEKVSTAAS